MGVVVAEVEEEEGVVVGKLVVGEEASAILAKLGEGELSSSRGRGVLERDPTTTRV